MPAKLEGGTERNEADRSTTTGHVETARTARHWWVWCSVAALAALAAACPGHTSGAPSWKAQPAPVTPTGTSIPTESATTSGDPRVIVDALNAAGLALCHSDYNDGAQYDVFGILGATATWRFFPHHTAVPVRADGRDALSCVAGNQPNSGVIEVDVYPSATDASAALGQVSHIWLDAWLDGNIAILVDQTTPPPIAEEVSGILGRVPGTTPFQLMPADSTIPAPTTAAVPKPVPPAPVVAPTPAPPAPAPRAAPVALVNTPDPARAQPAPAPASAPVAIPNPPPDPWNCATGTAYMAAHAAPGFLVICPATVPPGAAALTAITQTSGLPQGGIFGAEIVGAVLIADTTCGAAWMNEASNTWVLTGQSSAPIDPFGPCYV
jgi:hypothetical protein